MIRQLFHVAKENDYSSFFLMIDIIISVVVFVSLTTTELPKTAKEERGRGEYALFRMFFQAKTEGTEGGSLLT